MKRSIPPSSLIYKASVLGVSIRYYVEHYGPEVLEWHEKGFHRLPDDVRLYLVERLGKIRNRG